MPSPRPRQRRRTRQLSRNAKILRRKVQRTYMPINNNGEVGGGRSTSCETCCQHFLNVFATEKFILPQIHWREVRGEVTW